MQETITKKSKNINFNQAGYYAAGLIAMALLGFWPTLLPGTLKRIQPLQKVNLLNPLTSTMMG